MSFARAITALAALVAVSACAAPEPVVSAPPTTSNPTLAAPPPPSAPAPSGPPPSGLATMDDAVLPSSPVVVHFAHGKADITGSTMQVLWDIAPALKAANPAVIRVQGFTDASGKAAYNRALSEKRAQKVADQLRKLGITARVEVSGQGIVPGGKKGRKDAAARKVEISWEAPASAPASGKSAAAAPAPVSPDTVKASHDAPEGAAMGLALAVPAAPAAGIGAYGPVVAAAEASPGTYWAAPFEATGPPVLS